MSILSGLLSMLGWGTADFLVAKSSRKVGYVPTLFWMQIISVGVVSIYFLINFKSFNISDTPKFLVTLTIIGFLYTVAYLSFYKGLKIGQVSVVSPIAGSWVIVTVILSVIFYKEILQTSQIVAIILIILGIILVSVKVGEFLKIKRFAILKGAKEGLITMLGFGISPFLIVPIVRDIGWFFPILVFKLFIILFLISYIFFSKQSLKISFQPSLLVLLLSIGLLDTGAFFAYSFGVKGEYASIIAPIAASFPLVSVILARIFLKEKIVFNQVIGIAGVILGLILISV